MDQYSSASRLGSFFPSLVEHSVHDLLDFTTNTVTGLSINEHMFSLCRSVLEPCIAPTSSICCPFDLQQRHPRPHDFLHFVTVWSTCWPHGPEMLRRSASRVKPPQNCRYKWTGLTKEDKIALTLLEDKIAQAERTERFDIAAALKSPKTCVASPRIYTVLCRFMKPLSHMGGYSVPQKIRSFN